MIAQGVADILMVSGQTLPSASIRDWCKRWLESKSLEAEPRTHDRYETCIKRFLQFLGPKADEDLESLSVNDVLRFRDEVAKRLSAGSTNLELKILRACLYAAQRQDLMEKNVAAKVEILKQRGEAKRRAFSLDEVRKVLKQCDEAGGEWRGLVLMGLYTGPTPWGCGKPELVAGQFDQRADFVFYEQDGEEAGDGVSEAVIRLLGRPTLQ